MSYSETITRTDLTNILNEVLPFGYDDDVIKMVIFNISSVSLTANGTYTNTAIDVSAHIPSGYKLIGVDCKATGSNQVYCYHVGISGTTTAVLQLRNISSAITVTPSLTITCIKQEFANVGAKQADYIVEQGTNGIWTYRKWNSGIQEAWGYSSDSFAMTSGININQYYGSKSYSISALGFTAIHNIQITGGGGGAYFASKVESFNTSTINMSARASNTNTTTLSHWFYIKGTWK